jgi:uncharacterized membrane protein
MGGYGPLFVVTIIVLIVVVGALFVLVFPGLTNKIKKYYKGDDNDEHKKN